MYTVYKHITPNGKVYIGITCQSVNERWRNGNGYKNQVFYYAIQKYGWDSIRHEILFTGLTKKEAETKEIKLIALYHSNDPNYGYNIDNGGNCVGTHSDETKQKIGKANKGKVVSEEAKAKMKLNHANVKGANNPNYGKVFSDEVRKHMSDAQTGKHDGENNNMFGKHHSDESKYLQSLHRLGKCTGVDNHKSKAVNQYTKDGLLIKSYVCVKDAAKELKLPKGSDCHICACAKGKLKSAYGYVWKYAQSEVA